MVHFSIDKTLRILHEYFFCPNMHKDDERICACCILYKQAKSRTQPHGSYMPLPVLTHP